MHKNKKPNYFLHQNKMNLVVITGIMFHNSLQKVPLESGLIPKSDVLPDYIGLISALTLKRKGLSYQVNFCPAISSLISIPKAVKHPLYLNCNIQSDLLCLP